MNDVDYEVGAKCFFSPRGWKATTPEIIGRAFRVLDASLRHAGVQTVYHHAPVHIDAYTDEDGVEWPEGWELNASGISVCKRDGHKPHNDGYREFMCSRCGEIVDRAAYEAFAR